MFFYEANSNPLEHFTNLAIMYHLKKPSKPPPNRTNLNPILNLKLLPISVAAIFSISLLVIFFISSAIPLSKNGLLQEACKASRDPPICHASISSSGHVPPNPTLLDILQSAISASSDGIKGAQPMVNDILVAAAGNLNRINAAKTCLEMLDYADHRINLASAALPRGRIKDARAWMSAAMVYEYDCWSALKYVNGTSKVGETMSFLYSLIKLSSHAGSMMANFDKFGSQTASWGPVKTERDGFWEEDGGGLGFSFSGGVPRSLEADMTVCGGGGCDYEKVQEAVNAASYNEGRRFVIHIKTGVYEETVRVPLEKKNVVFLGDGMGRTVITGSRNVAQSGMSTFNSATVGVIGDGFMAKGLTIQNTAGPGAHQAVAFRSDSDLSVIEHCEFLGNQDTLYAHSLRQYYRACRIQGNVDFIFGNSAAFFQDCLVLVAPRQIKPEKGERNAITAHGRIDPVQSTGFVFHNCVVNGTEEYMALYNRKPTVHRNFLGRPWKEYSRTVFINCTLSAIITSAGWMPWRGDFALETLYYGEYENSGPGANTSGRVAWSSQIPVGHVESYSVQNFIQGNEWIPTS